MIHDFLIIVIQVLILMIEATLTIINSSNN